MPRRPALRLDSAVGQSGAVVANGVTLASGAMLTLDDLGGATLPAGTTFTVVSNTSSLPIAGRFAGLADGGSVTVGTNEFQTNYEGANSQ